VALGGSLGLGIVLTASDLASGAIKSVAKSFAGLDDSVTKAQEKFAAKLGKGLFGGIGMEPTVGILKDLGKASAVAWRSASPGSGRVQARRRPPTSSSGSRSSATRRSSRRIRSRTFRKKRARARRLGPDRAHADVRRVPRARELDPYGQPGARALEPTSTSSAPRSAASRRSRPAGSSRRRSRPSPSSRTTRPTRSTSSRAPSRAGSSRRRSPAPWSARRAARSSSGTRSRRSSRRSAARRPRGPPGRAPLRADGPRRRQLHGEVRSWRRSACRRRSATYPSRRIRARRRSPGRPGKGLKASVSSATETSPSRSGCRSSRRQAGLLDGRLRDLAPS
jgi:hypothetical protein